MNIDSVTLIIQITQLVFAIDSTITCKNKDNRNNSITMIVVTKNDAFDLRFNDDADALCKYECTKPIIHRSHDTKIIVQVPWDRPDPQTQLLREDHDFMVPQSKYSTSVRLDEIADAVEDFFEAAISSLKHCAVSLQHDDNKFLSKFLVTENDTIVYNGYIIMHIYGVFMTTIQGHKMNLMNKTGRILGMDEKVNKWLYTDKEMYGEHTDAMKLACLVYQRKLSIIHRLEMIGKGEVYTTHASAVTNILTMFETAVMKFTDQIDYISEKIYNDCQVEKKFEYNRFHNLINHLIEGLSNDLKIFKE